MAQHSEFLAFVLERMAPIASVRARAMFSGHGLFHDGCMFAIVVNGRLYLKADAQTRSDFEGHGLRPFTYTARGRLIALQYYEAPADVHDDPDQLRFWLGAALAAAARAQQVRCTRRPASKT